MTTKPFDIASEDYRTYSIAFYSFCLYQKYIIHLEHDSKKDLAYMTRNAYISYTGPIRPHHCFYQ